VALEDKVARLRQETGGAPGLLQGVAKDRIRQVLAALDLAGNADLVDCVFALLDDETDSWFSKAPDGAKLADGASTAHLACHIGIFQRGHRKLDREGRDYWIKPLRDLGGFQAITLHEGEFVAGHVKAKSPNSSYRLNEDLKAILKAPPGDWTALLASWISEDAARERLAFQAEMAEAARARVDGSHAALIKASIDYYAPRFLPGYTLLYVDDADGDRISEEERARMCAAGIELRLEDAMPDALFWHPQQDSLWVIEAVTSDGEVDMHKVVQMRRLAERCGKANIGFTTTYETWKTAAARQGVHRNIAVDTFIWIASDPAKQFRVEA
jgi:hypothetical protein